MSGRGRFGGLRVLGQVPSRSRPSGRAGGQGGQGPVGGWCQRGSHEWRVQVGGQPCVAGVSHVGAGGRAAMCGGVRWAGSHVWRGSGG